MRLEHFQERDPPTRSPVRIERCTGERLRDMRWARPVHDERPAAACTTTKNATAARGVARGDRVGKPRGRAWQRGSETTCPICSDSPAIRWLRRRRSRRHARGARRRTSSKRARRPSIASRSKTRTPSTWRLSRTTTSHASARVTSIAPATRAPTSRASCAFSPCSARILGSSTPLGTRGSKRSACSSW